MDFKFSSKITFKEISKEYLQNSINKIRFINVDYKKVIGICVDIDSLSKDEKDILYNDGNYTPSLIYYWTSLLFELDKICKNMNYNSFWLDTVNKRYFDETLSTFMDLITDSIRWQNNSSFIQIIWGKFEQDDIFKKRIECTGLIMPADEGWGIIALLNMDDYFKLKNFFS